MEESPTGLLLEVGEEFFRVDVLGDELFRLKISQARYFDEAPTFSVIQNGGEAVEFQIEQTETTIVASTKEMKLIIERDPFRLSAFRTDGSVLFEDAQDETGEPIGYLRLNDTFVVTRKIGSHDPIYGLGQRTGASNRRGRNFILWNTDILQPEVLEQNRLHETDVDQHGGSTAFDPYYSSTPFFYHCRDEHDGAKMAGFFVDNAYKAHFEFEHEDVYRYRFEGGQYTEYVFAGPQMPDILAQFTTLTGRMEVPPLWALGLHQCRFHDYAQNDILRLSHEYRNREIPCDVLWLDIDYMDGYRVFTWDQDKYDDLEGMLAELRERKFRAIAIVDPGVKFEPGYSIFDEGEERGFFCKTEGGNLYVGQVWPGETVFPDFSRDEVRCWWGELNARHVAVGLSGIWNDMNEPATGEVPPFAMRFGEGGGSHPHERFHNQYALLMAMGTYQGLKERAPNLRPFILTRAGCAGIQRYAAQWTGDNESSWAHLALSIPMSCSMGISGQAFIGSDVPGFMGRPTSEMAVRWAQYGALTPFCRYHNTKGEPDQYPWSFGKSAESRAREAIALRYMLLPYIYTCFFEASETGAPIQRPLVYHHQDDPEAREIDDEYFFGPSLLVAPIIEAGCTSRNVYLPEGSWIDDATGQVYEGSQVVTVAAPLERIPLFVRGGAVVPFFPKAPVSTMDHAPEVVELGLFVPLEDGEFVSRLREDDGLTNACENGAFLQTTFTVVRAGDTVKLAAACCGDGFSELARSSFRLRVYGAKAKRMQIDGRPVDASAAVIQFANHGEEFSAEITLE